MSLLPVGISGEAQYQISRSLRFNSADSAYLNRTPGSAGSRTTWTFSCWAKKCKNGSGLFLLSADPSNASYIYWTTADIIKIRNSTAEYESTPVYRDLSAWYHLVWVWDTTNATAGNRTRLWVNGVEVNNWTVETHPSLNEASGINNNVIHNIGRYTITSSFYYDGYLTEINFIDGQALTPSSFGETDTVTGVWKPKKYTGTYGTNGFYLNFSDNASTTTLGDDFSGNGNDWTLNNFSVTAGAGNDSLVDTPTSYGTDTGVGGEVRGNYCTMNPLDKREFSTDTIATSNGNLDVLLTAGNGETVIRATTGVSSGKYYCEVTVGTTNSGIGVADATSSINTVGFGGVNSWTYYSGSGNIWNNGGQTAYGNTYTTNDVIGIAIDMDSGKAWFAKNGTWQNSGSPTSGTNAAVTTLSGRTVTVTHTNGGSNSSGSWNFGQRPFAYTAPSGFKALCTQNLPTPTIEDGGDYFNTILYTGTGSSNARTGVGFQPDFVWIKERSGAADHALYDAVRGVQQQLESNTTTDETTESTGLTAFGSDGFTVGSLAQVNTNTDTYVAWNWKESTVSKFDIVTYTGNGTARTISHNLGVVPNMIIVKARTTASTDQGWAVYHSANTANPETDYLLLNSTAATADLDTVWNDTAPTSSVFSVGTNALVNANNDTYVAYLFANVAGYSAFGSYTGNGSADGPFVYTGFRPRFVLVKSSSNVTNWLIFDTARGTYNEITAKALWANLANAEGGTNEDIDILSNGFKPRDASASFNINNYTYIYAAFAENPFKYSLAR